MDSVGCAQQNGAVDFEFKTKSEHIENNLGSDKVEYSIYGILNFLQSEWTKMSIERSRWEFERAELQVLFDFLTITSADQNFCSAKRETWMRKLEK